MNLRHSFILPTIVLLAAPYLVLGSDVFSLLDFHLDPEYIGVSITERLVGWAESSRLVVYPGHGVDPNLKSLLTIISKVFTKFDTIYLDISRVLNSISNARRPYFMSIISRSFDYFNKLLHKKKSTKELHLYIECTLTETSCEFATHLANTMSTIVLNTSVLGETDGTNSIVYIKQLNSDESEAKRKTSLLITYCRTKVSTGLKVMLKDVDGIVLQLVAYFGGDAAAREPIPLFEAMTDNVRFCEHVLELKKLETIIYKIEYKVTSHKFVTWAYSWWLMEQYVRKHQVKVIIMDYVEYGDTFLNMYLENRWDSNQSVPYNVSYVYEQLPTTKSDTTVVISSVLMLVILILVPIVLAVYKCYIRPLQSQEYLTVTEFNEFFKGLPVQASADYPEWMKKKYTKSLEIKKSDFQLDKTNKLGEGEFGIVYKGSLSTVADGDVAFKMAKCSRNNIVGLKGLMSEIKILDYVGTHENVVSLIGAYTAKLRKGILYVAYEFCPVGSLHKYLEQLYPTRSNRTLDLSLMPNSNDYVMETGFNDTDSLREEEEWEPENMAELSKQLTKYCLEICTGMEYLAIKKIIHGDLATRNVLLTSSLKAKICDFGLSRRVYSYSEYVSKGELPMAWRWMAPETLQKKGVLSRKTDVWSFGVTIWEIFSFGAVPFSGYNCDTAFVERLEYGMLRLPMPERCSQFFYDVMLSCWKINPSSRPNFTQLLETLSIQ